MRFCCFFLLLSLLFLNEAAFAAHSFNGKASWYGSELHGRRTASGERFDMHKLTAAHRSLPFGTKVLVKNHRTGRTCVVTVNDRGPHRASRCIDISQAAAKEIGMWPNGEAHLTCTVLGKGKHVEKALLADGAQASSSSPRERKSSRKHRKHHEPVVAQNSGDAWRRPPQSVATGTKPVRRQSGNPLAVPAEVASAWQSL